MTSVSLVKFQSNGTTPLYTFNFSNFSTCSLKYNTPVTTQPLPEEGDENNVLMKLEGNSTVIDFVWTVRDESANQETTAGSASRYVDEIIDFFGEKMSPKHLEDSYKLVISFPHKALTIYGTINDFKFDIDAGAIAVGSFTFYKGKVVAVYELDPPSQPNDFTASSSGAGKIETTWTIPNFEGSSSITGYIAQYKKSTSSDWTSNGVGAATFLKNWTGLSAGTYIVRILASNSNGNSLPTPLITVVVT